MKEIGIVNRDIATIISEQGHADLLLICDSGFPIPKGIKVVDISLAENKPMVMDFLNELSKYFSVEKMIMAKQTKDTNPTLFNKISKAFGNDVEHEIIEHTLLKEKAKDVKAVIRTGDFTAYANVILISGAGDRWYCEIK